MFDVYILHGHLVLDRSSSEQDPGAFGQVAIRNHQHVLHLPHGGGRGDLHGFPVAAKVLDEDLETLKKAKHEVIYTYYSSHDSLIKAH